MESPHKGPMTAEREIVVSRTIGAPRHLVFEAYTTADHLSRWWGPRGFRTTTHAFEFHPGGVWDFTMHGPDGTDYPNLIEWIEIIPPERLAFRHGSHPGDPEVFTATVTLVDRGDTTEVTLRSLFSTRQQRDRVVEQFGAIEGAEQTLEALEGYVRREIGTDGR